MEILKSKKQSKSVYEITAYRRDIDEFFFFTLHRYKINGWALLDEDGDVLQTFRTKQAAMEWLNAEEMTGIHVGQIH